MKNNCTRLICIILGLLMALTACAGQGQAQYPEDFSLYYNLIGEKKAVVLRELGLNESELNESHKGLYTTPRTARYRGLVFEVLLDFDLSTDTLWSVRYLKSWRGERETAIQELVALSQGLTTLFGPAQTPPGYENPTRVTKLTAQELDRAFAEKPQRWSVTDYWYLEEERNQFDCMVELQVVAVDDNDVVSAVLRISPNVH